MTTPSLRIVGVLLAAGESSRLGRPKQLIEFQGQPLVARALEQLRVAGCTSVTTVLGANAERIRPVLAYSDSQIVFNPAWKTGMGSSIRCAMKEVVPKADAVLFALCDQPLIETDHYRKLIDAIMNGDASLAATAYPNSDSGVPAVFASQHFESLANLPEAFGAKQIIHSVEHDRIEVTGRLLDIDSEKDLEELANFDRCSD